MIYWFFGQPGTGKTSLATKLKNKLVTLGVNPIYLDGDALRVASGNAYSKETFTKEYRIKQTEALQRFVALLSDQGQTVIIATVNPYQEVREKFALSRMSSISNPHRKKYTGLSEAHTDLKYIYVFTDKPRVRGEYWVSDFEVPEWVSLNNFIEICTTDKSETESFYELWKQL